MINKNPERFHDVIEKIEKKVEKINKNWKIWLQWPKNGRFYIQIDTEKNQFVAKITKATVDTNYKFGDHLNEFKKISKIMLKELGDND